MINKFAELKKMIRLANHLDSIGLYSEADILDQSIAKYAQQAAQASFTERGMSINLMSPTPGSGPGGTTIIFVGNDCTIKINNKTPNEDQVLELFSQISALTEILGPNSTNVRTQVIDKLKTCIDRMLGVTEGETTKASGGVGAPRAGGCVVKIPGDTATIYDYQVSSNTFSVRNGRNMGYVFRKGTPGYEKLMREGRGDCIPRITRELGAGSEGTGLTGTGTGGGGTSEREGGVIWTAGAFELSLDPVSGNVIAKAKETGDVVDTVNPTDSRYKNILSDAERKLSARNDTVGVAAIQRAQRSVV